MGFSVAEGCFVGGFLCLLGVVIFVETDARTLVQWSVKGFIGLGVLAMLVSKLEFWINRIKNMDNQKVPVPKVDLVKQRERMMQAREKKQEEHTVLAEDFKDRVLRPRQEAQLKKKEEDLARAQGVSWRGKGQKLGRLQLPAEPATDSDGCVTVALRDPEGELHQRRFSSDHKIQNVLDYMTLLGFPQSHYTLTSAFPRRYLDDSATQTLVDCGLLSRVSLNIELRDE